MTKGKYIRGMGHNIIGVLNMSEYILTREKYEHYLKNLRYFCVIVALVMYMMAYWYVDDALVSALIAICLAIQIYFVVWWVMKRKYKEDQRIIDAREDGRLNIWKKPLWEERE
ncbi:MAG: DUF3021 family protein [Candidatus Hodarchaeales archaeon]